MITIPAMFAMRPGRLVQTLSAFARFCITIAHPIQIDIVIAIATLTRTARHIRIAKVIVRALVTARSRVALPTIAHHIQCSRIPLTLIRMRMIRGHRSGTQTRSTTDLTAQRRITIVPFHAAIALCTSRVIGATVAFAGARITCRRMPIALTLLAIVEIPKARLTLITLATVRIRSAAALAGDLIAFTIERTDLIAVALFAALRPKAVRSRCATIALATDHVRFALAQATVGVAFFRQRTGRIAVAR